jgi:hypothetical protein
MKPPASTTLQIVQSISDGVAIIIVWCLLFVAGCASKPPEKPRTVGEFINLPRVGEELRAE